MAFLKLENKTVHEHDDGPQRLSSVTEESLAILMSLVSAWNIIFQRQITGGTCFVPMPSIYQPQYERTSLRQVIQTDQLFLKYLHLLLERDYGLWANYTTCTPGTCLCEEHYLFQGTTFGPPLCTRFLKITKSPIPSVKAAMTDHDLGKTVFVHNTETI